MKCSNCNYCWQNPEDMFPRCHYEGAPDTAPCEIEPAPTKSQQFAHSLAQKYNQYWSDKKMPSLWDELNDDDEEDM